jgi:hypothetical protein
VIITGPTLKSCGTAYCFWQAHGLPCGSYRFTVSVSCPANISVGVTIGGQQFGTEEDFLVMPAGSYTFVITLTNTIGGGGVCSWSVNVA